MGDVLCQFMVNHLDGHERGFDAKRAAIFTVLGGGVISPMLHVWYKLLGALLPGVAPLTIAKRLALDQLVFAPTFLPVFLSLVMTLEGHVEQIPDKLRADWWPVTKANWVVWVPAQFINFRFVPSSMQVLFSNVLGLLWNAYLSYVSHSGVPKKETIGDEEVTHVEEVQS
uniref:Uncharacterized protein n=1 Tax=Hyaloperonospora arabidopsidis (strain Emoy2) TaxID=559515 RepID=M4BN28_HYAAE